MLVYNQMLFKKSQTKIKLATQILRAGGLVAFPTDTVYGLGADASNPAAMAKIFALKNRPLDRPLAVLISDIKQLKKLVSEISPTALLLAKHFWPGALTLILPSMEKSIGVRMPNHSVALALLKEFGGAIATTSVNFSGQQSLLQTEQVQTEFGNAIDLILEGDCAIGIESTVIDLTLSQPKILRAGAITEDEINRVLDMQ